MFWRAIIVGFAVKPKVTEIGVSRYRYRYLIQTVGKRQRFVSPENQDRQILLMSAYAYQPGISLVEAV